MSLDPVVSLLVAVLVLLIGTVVNRRVELLSRYNIPDPITGGLLFAAIASVVWVDRPISGSRSTRRSSRCCC